MSAVDQQLMVKDEVTYGTPVTPDRTFEFNSESITDSYGRTEGTPLRTGQYYKRNDRFTPWYAGAAGSVQMDVLTKGFGWWLKHMLGTSATTGPTETSVYTHTGTVGDLTGDFFTLQVSRPLHPSGTAQAFTYTGGKVVDWTISNSVDGNLVLDLNCDFQAVSTATGLATAAYPASMENLTWAGGTVTIAAVQYDVTEFSCQGTNGPAVDRRFIRANTLKKEPIGGQREASWSISGDFDATTLRANAAGATRAATLATIVAKWVGPTLLGSTIYPTFQLTIDESRFDTWAANNSAPEPISQTLTGTGLFDGATSALTVVYQSADVTA